MAEWRPFNVNHKVRIKVTERGRAALKKQIDDLNTFIASRGGKPLPYRELKEDAEGWSEWQMWDVMQTFGPAITMGLPVPFETTIQIGPDE